MNKLNLKLMQTLSETEFSKGVIEQKALPVKVVQFGEGNFLRGFIDWMIDRMNKQGLFNGSVAVVQPIEKGLAEALEQQDGLYTLYLRGLQAGRIVEEKSLVGCIKTALNPYADYQGFLALAENPDLRFVISNTTEAGIAYQPSDRFTDAPPSSFPGKLTAFLYHRYSHFNGNPDKGLVIIPCELIDRNGDTLREIVLRLADEWKLGEGFIRWLTQANDFLNSLVDRIVTGYPAGEAEKMFAKLAYRDAMLDTAESFHLWVIQSPKDFTQELPLAQAGLNVIWTEDMTPYRTRKVRILNGAHTMTVLAAYLMGKNTVLDCMQDNILRQYMNLGLSHEIIPTLDLPKEELDSFAASVVERFSNPFITHYLLSISLNSVSKFKTRLLPSIKEYSKRKGKTPRILAFSLAALILFYRGEINGGKMTGRRAEGDYPIADDTLVLAFFQSSWDGFTETAEDCIRLVERVLSRAELWGENLNSLPGFAEAVANHLNAMLTKGITAAIQNLITETIEESENCV